MGTDRDWEKWGRDDPYFGVLSDEAYRVGNMSESSYLAFFATGESHVEHLLQTIRTHFKRDFTPESSLDFGCGVGRILIPLARQSRRATGVDVAPSMLAETRRNCERLKASNVELAISDDSLSALKESYDLIHSHIVFAHIDPRRGHAIVEALAAMVRPGGFIAVQVLYSCNEQRWIRALIKLRYRFPPANALRNLMRGRPLREPAMQLHIYDLRVLLRGLRRKNFANVLLLPESFDNEKYDSVVLIAQRDPGA